MNARFCYVENCLQACLTLRMGKFFFSKLGLMAALYFKEIRSTGKLDNPLFHVDCRAFVNHYKNGILGLKIIR